MLKAMNQMNRASKSFKSTVAAEYTDSIRSVFKKQNDTSNMTTQLPE